MHHVHAARGYLLRHTLQTSWPRCSACGMPSGCASWPPAPQVGKQRLAPRQPCLLKCWLIRAVRFSTAGASCRNLHPLAFLPTSTDLQMASRCRHPLWTCSRRCSSGCAALHACCSPLRCVLPACCWRDAWRCALQHGSPKWLRFWLAGWHFGVQPALQAAIG